jgi:NhaP-type Na+/H+ or K+/H+ antiporter
MPQIVYEIIDLLASILRLIGTAVLGVGLGWLSLDLLRKAEAWQMQVAVYLGLLGLVIALAVFTALGALGAFCIGLGVAIFVWGMPKKKKEEEDEK